MSQNQGILVAIQLFRKYIIAPIIFDNNSWHWKVFITEYLQQILQMGQCKKLTLSPSHQEAVPRSFTYIRFIFLRTHIPPAIYLLKLKATVAYSDIAFAAKHKPQNWNSSRCYFAQYLVLFISDQGSYLIPSENKRKLLVFRCYQGV